MHSLYLCQYPLLGGLSTTPGFGKATQAYCFKCGHKRKCYKFRGWCVNDRQTVIIADDSRYNLCQECAYKTNDPEHVDRLIKLGILAAWKPRKVTVDNQLPMEGI